MVFPEDPGKAVAQAHTLGLQALVDLLRERTNKDTNHLHSKAQKRLDIALENWRSGFSQGNPDFAPVADQEKGLRDLELENIWETTASYGNTETKRIRNEREGIVGPLNKLINIFGAKLRNYFLLFYSLNTPVKIGKQKKKTIWGYVSEEFGLVPVAHGADLAELDLADMIRSHGRELCRKSFSFGVPPKDFDSYALLLIRRLTPFIDYIYSDALIGSEYFLRPRTNITRTSRQGKCADEILRELVEEMNGLYAKGSIRRVFPTMTRKEGVLPKKEFFQDQIKKLREGSKIVSKEESRRYLIWVQFLKKLTLEKNSKLRDQDAKHLYDIVRNKVRWEGIRYHSLITDGLPQTYSAKSIIMDGERFLQSGEDILIVGESRLGTAEGPGRMDLALFVRTVVTNPKKPGQLVVMKPIAVFDIKTKTGFNWEIGTKKTKGKRKKTVARFTVRKRGLTDDEWNDAISEVPAPGDFQQLKLYAAGLVREYRKLTGNETFSDILKGIVLLDTQFNAGMNRFVVRLLLKGLIENQGLSNTPKDCERLLVRSKDPVAQRAALILLSPDEEQFAVLDSERKPQEDVESYGPFSKTRNTTIQHILYLSARSASNSGFTGAWLAQYWHGLQYLQQLSSEDDDATVTWLDLSGEFRHDELAKRRLRILYQNKDVQDFFNKINIVDMSPDVDRFLFRGENLPDIVSILSKGKEGKKKIIVVVSGWQWIEDSLPPRLKSVLEELERYMVQAINNVGCATVWFLQPRPDERTSEKYRSRCLLPFWDSSEHRFHVTELVWNLPVRPYTSIQTTPMLDDLRVIIKQTMDSVETNLVEVPLLENWSSRFWSKRSKRKSKISKGTRGRDALSAKDVIKMTELRKELINDSIDLIPWLCALHPASCSKEDDNEIKLTTQIIPLYGSPNKPKSVMSRMLYRAKARGARGMRSYVTPQKLIPKETITHPRHYRSCRRKKRKAVNTQTYRAPDEIHLEFRKLREHTARNVEVRRLKQTLKLLSRNKESWSIDTSWCEFLKQLDGIIPDTNNSIEIDDLNKISELLVVHNLTFELWKSILWFRERRLGNRLRLNESDHLETLLESRPYVVTLFGNYIFLLLVAIARKYPDLRIDQIQNLWATVKSWHLRQIGFYLRDLSGVSRPKFDVRAVWSNLCKRASVLTQIPQPVQSGVRCGQLLVVPSGDGYEYWVFLEDRYDQSRFRSGLWIGQNPLDPTSSIRWSESDTREIADHASTAEPEEVHNLITCQTEWAEYVWFFAEEEWNLLGELMIIPRKRDAITSIRGLQVLPLSSSEIPEVPAGLTIPLDLSNRIENELIEIGQMRQHIISVQCELGIDSGMYSISFKTDGETLDIRFFERTSDLLHILRRPLVDGVPLQSTKDPNFYFTWDTYQDIEYAELQLFRPYVERKMPYVHMNAPLPFTCQELLSQPSESISIVITHDSEVCPVADGSSNIHSACWRIMIKDVVDDADLLALIDQRISDIDIVSLMKAREVFFDGARYEMEIDFKNDPTTREGIVFRESKLIARQLGLRPVTPGVSLMMGTEKLNWDITQDGGVIEIHMMSDVTGERVDTLRMQILEDSEWDVDEMLEEAGGIIDEFVELHFGSDEEADTRITGLDSLLEDIKSKLINIKLEVIESLPTTEDSLSFKLDLYRQASSVDSLYEESLAETLYELAKIHLKNQDFSDASEVIDECIEVYKSYNKVWKEDWVKDKLRAARSLKTRIRRRT